MIKEIMLFSKKNKIADIFLFILMILCFVFFGGLAIFFANKNNYLIVLINIMNVVFVLYTSIMLFLGILESKNSKIIIDYESKSITINLKKRFYYRDVDKEKKCSIYLQAHFNEIDGIELKEVEDKGLTNIKINVNGKETDIPMDKVLELWKTPQKEQFVEELIQELEILAKAIKETKQI